MPSSIMVGTKMAEARTCENETWIPEGEGSAEQCAQKFAGEDKQRDCRALVEKPRHLESIGGGRVPGENDFATNCPESRNLADGDGKTF